VRISVGADDTAPVVEAVVADLRRRGHEPRVYEPEPWPEVAHKVASDVAEGRAGQGILFCWTGTGTSIVANKVPGVRAALAWEPWIAEGARLWNDANVLVMSLKRTTPELAIEILEAWFKADKPDASEAANIQRIAAIERHYRT
jgi:ribose 5-phosphate isomerase B